MQKKLLGKPVKPTKSFAEIRQEWEKIQGLDIKNRFKLMRSVAYEICEIFQKNDIELEHLLFYIDVLKQVNQVHDIPRCKRSLSKMIATWLNLTGHVDAKIVKKIAGKINTETASIAIGDPYYAKNVIDAYGSYTEKNVLNLINEGKSYIFGTSSDGLHNVQLRIVDSSEPVLSSKEFKCVTSVTETAIINIPTGHIAVTDPCFLDVEKDRLGVDVEPGHYKVCVYFFYIHSKVESFYIVLCKTDQEDKNNLSKSPQFN